MAKRRDWADLSQDEKIEHIKSGLARKLTLSAIADEWPGATRGAIAGMMYRNRLHFPAVQKMVEPTDEEVPPMIEAKEAAVAEPEDDHVVIPFPPSIQAEPTSPIDVPEGGVHFLKRLSGQCCYPLWQDDRKPTVSELFYCGKPVKPNSEYCAECHPKLYYKPAPEKKPELTEEEKFKRKLMRGAA